jgi:dienelactone hydrolase
MTPLSMTQLSATHRNLVGTVPLRAGARLKERTVAYGHEGQALEGYAVHDAGAPGRKPAVIVLHDWTGLREYPKARAQMLARLGYFAFAADLYGVGRRFDRVKDSAAEASLYYEDLALLRGRVRAAYDEVARNPAVDPSRVVVIGYCFGGTAALEFARTGARLVGTVSIHGGLVTHEPPDVAAITGEVLVLTGGADPYVPDSEVVTFENELRTRDDLVWQVTTYSGAPHAFTVPGEEYHALADRRSWRDLVAFLDEVIA